MGKGNRNRELRESEVSVQDNGAKLSKLQLIKKQEKKDKTIRIVALVLIIAIILGIAVSIFIVNYNSKWKLSKTVSGKSESYNIDNSMVAYFLYDEYQSLVTNYQTYLSTFGLDTTVSLKSQAPNDMAAIYLGYNKSYSWFENFLINSVAKLNQFVALAEKAKTEGYKLSDEENKSIDDTIESIKSSAKASGLTADEYLANIFVVGVNVKTVKRCLELQTLASDYYTDLTGKYSFTDDEKLEYANKNKSSFYTFDYISYTFDAKYASDANDDQKAQAIADAKSKAEALLEKATNEEAFKSEIVILDKENEEASESETETKEKGDDEYLSDNIKKDQAYSESETDFYKWAFNEERKVGDTTMIAVDDDSFTVYMITKTLALKADSTKNVRHILIDDTVSDDPEAKANDILNSFSPDKTEEDFAELAKEFTTDPGSKENGGLYENVAEGDMVTEFNDWLFDESRTPGETGIVKTDYGYHIMYYVGEGEPLWKLNADSGLKSEKYSSDLEQLEKDYPITWDDDKLNEL